MANFSGLDSAHLSAGSKEPRLRRDRPTMFSMRYCGWAHRALLVAAKKNVELDIVNVDLHNKPEWYFDKHPLGTVPSIQDGDFMAIESGNIIEYLEEKYPEPRLVADTPEERAVDRGFVYLYERRIGPRYVALKSAKDPREFQRVWRDFLDDLTWLESALVERGSFLFGGRYVRTVDYCVYPWFERFLALEKMGLIKMPWGDFPTLSTWMARMAGDSAVVALKAPTDKMVKFLESSRNGEPKYDFVKGA